jgi:FtsZ-interacting cell division protein ZipA
MSTTVIVIIVVAVIVILLVAGIWALTRKRREHQRVEAQGIRTRAAEQELEVGQREARAEETAARSRAAKAEVKAAQAEQLAQRAHAHRGEAADSRTELDKEWERADKVDPDSKSREAQSGADPERPSPPRTGGVP